MRLKALAFILCLAVGLCLAAGCAARVLQPGQEAAAPSCIPCTLTEDGGWSGELTFLKADADYLYLFRAGTENPEEQTRAVFFYMISRMDGVVHREMTFETAWSTTCPEDALRLRVREEDLLMLAPDAVYRVEYDLGAPEKIPLPDAVSARMALEGGGEDARYTYDFDGYDVSDDLTEFVWADRDGVHSYRLELPADELAERIEDKYWTEKAGNVYGGEIPEGTDTILAPAGTDWREYRIPSAETETPPEASGMAGAVSCAYGTAYLSQETDKTVRIYFAGTDGTVTGLWSGETAPELLGFSEDGWLICGCAEGFWLFRAFELPEEGPASGPDSSGELPGDPGELPEEAPELSLTEEELAEIPEEFS